MRSDAQASDAASSFRRLGCWSLDTASAYPAYWVGVLS